MKRRLLVFGTAAIGSSSDLDLFDVSASLDVFLDHSFLPLRFFFKRCLVDFPLFSSLFLKFDYIVVPLLNYLH